jgi:hypothetical protein
VGGGTPPSVSCPLENSVSPLVLLFCSSQCFHLVFASLYYFALNERRIYITPPPHTHKPCTSLGKEKARGGGGRRHTEQIHYLLVYLKALE